MILPHLMHVSTLPDETSMHACVQMNRTCPLCRADVTELMKMDVDWYSTTTTAQQLPPVHHYNTSSTTTTLLQCCYH